MTAYSFVRRIEPSFNARNKLLAIPESVTTPLHDLHLHGARGHTPGTLDRRCDVVVDQSNVFLRLECLHLSQDQRRMGFQTAFCLVKSASVQRRTID